MGKLINKLINGVVTLLIFLTEGSVDASPILELDTGLIDLFDLEKTVFDRSCLTFGSHDAWWVQFDGIGGWDKVCIGDAGTGKVFTVE